MNRQYFDTDFFNATVKSIYTSNNNWSLHTDYIYNNSVVENNLSDKNQVKTSTTDESAFKANFSEFDRKTEFIWSVFDEQYLRHSLGWTLILVVAYTLVLITGVIGNLMVILVVIKRPQMRNVTNMFVMNLAVADLFVILFCVPATLLSNVFTPWLLGSVTCKGVAYVQGVSVCASAYSLTAISLDRCKAIYRPLESHGGLSKRQAVPIISLIWFTALLLTIPWAIIFDVVFSKTDGNPYCIETWEDETHGNIYYLVANLFCCYCLPLILISISNIIIWRHVSKRQLPQDEASAAIVKKIHQRTRHGVRKMLGIVTFAFLLSWLPLYILVSRLKFTKNIGAEELALVLKLLPFAQWLGSMNSSINPILYGFLNKKFRIMFKSLLPTWLPLVQNDKPRTINTYVFRGTNFPHRAIPVGTDLTTRFETMNVTRTDRRMAKDKSGNNLGLQQRYNESTPKSVIVSGLGESGVKTVVVNESYGNRGGILVTNL